LESEGKSDISLETLNFIQGKALQNIPLKPWKNYWSLFWPFPARLF
jgi:hypothetical protein